MRHGSGGTGEGPAGEERDEVDGSGPDGDPETHGGIGDRGGRRSGGGEGCSILVATLYRAACAEGNALRREA
jgi:hypothetical protein